MQLVALAQSILVGKSAVYGLGKFIAILDAASLNQYFKVSLARAEDQQALIFFISVLLYKRVARHLQHGLRKVIGRSPNGSFKRPEIFVASPLPFGKRHHWHLGCIQHLCPSISMPASQAVDLYFRKMRGFWYPLVSGHRTQHLDRPWLGFSLCTGFG